ncbi:hypothetical protein TSOC_013439 [Tetrabaena socialis]|uniref:Uncharacterized protein n=1 Tax=Tetrabaena socialis TaxID=47790 RepID=A0A2J7ZKC7_9CHLO|nr:hypothetical protein TSOC_013439 [Tetrabaena socialis]|eukprot:PNH00728.1 hypothetical protein TSOC_013439 [Tetrabaena socialis]
MAFTACSRRCVGATPNPAPRPLGAGLTTLIGARATIRGALAPQPARIAASRTPSANASDADPSSFPASDPGPPRPSETQPGRNRSPAAERAQQDEWLVQWVKAHGTHAWEEAVQEFMVQFPTAALGSKPNERLSERAQHDEWLVQWVKAHGTRAWKEAVQEFMVQFPTAALGSRPNERLSNMYHNRALKKLAPADRTQLRPPSLVPAAELAQQDEWLVQWVKAHGTRAWKKAVQEFMAQFPTAALGSNPNQRLSIMYHNRARKKLAPSESSS